MRWNPSAFLEALPIALEGWLGVIIVIGLIVLIVYGFNFFFKD